MSSGLNHNNCHVLDAITGVLKPISGRNKLGTHNLGYAGYIVQAGRKNKYNFHYGQADCRHNFHALRQDT